MDLACDLSVAFRALTGEVKKEKKIDDAVGFVHNLRFFRDFTRDQVKELMSASHIVKVGEGASQA